MGHTDVVPVTPSGWTRDPFGGELVDGEVWGRGAIDMLNLTASMAVAHEAPGRAQGWRPKGTLIYFAVADEEAGGHWGAEWALEHERDAVAADYVLTESGGLVMDTPGRPEGHGHRRREGRGVAPAARPRHARARLDAVRRRQRAGQGGRGRAPPRRVPAARADQRPVARTTSTRSTSTDARARRSATPTPSSRRAARFPTRASPSSLTRARTRRSRRMSRTAA